VGTARNGTALPYDTSKLADGSHRIRWDLHGRMAPNPAVVGSSRSLARAPHRHPRLRRRQELLRRQPPQLPLRRLHRRQARLRQQPLRRPRPLRLRRSSPLPSPRRRPAHRQRLPRRRRQRRPSPRVQRRRCRFRMGLVPNGSWPSLPPATISGNASVLDGPATAPAGAIVVPAENNSSLDLRQVARRTGSLRASTHSALVNTTKSSRATTRPISVRRARSSTGKARTSTRSPSTPVTS
jgi:hypothetical protein